MIEIQTEVQLTGVSGKAIADFLLHCTDSEYQKWWPGTHLTWHTKKQFPNDIGNVIYFDEYVGEQRLKCEAVVVSYIPAKEIIWQLKKFVRLPVWLIIRFEDNEEGTLLIHTLKAGLPILGGLLDRLLKLFFNKQFEKDMDEHAHIEFRKLAAILA
jgi:hypothetical protein